MDDLIRPDLPARLAVLLSGRGSNFLALEAAVRSGRIPASIAVVVSDRPDAAGLLRARELGLPAEAVDRKAFPDRASHESAVEGILGSARPDLVCLAGYMRLLSADFVGRWPGRILNIHPSLLPAFPGTHSQRQALDYGVRVSGCTVHFVDAGLDSGPIVAQEAVEVREGDTEELLGARILEVEHRIYPSSVAALLERGWRLRGRQVLLGETSPASS
jgi:phosphoribosylglycinamide formyltransferase-1